MEQKARGLLDEEAQYVQDATVQRVVKAINEP
jgi:hypothetical protein